MQVTNTDERGSEITEFNNQQQIKKKKEMEQKYKVVTLCPTWRRSPKFCEVFLMASTMACEPSPKRLAHKYKSLELASP